MLARAPVSFAVLASGSGSNFEALVHASRTGGFPGSIALLLCDQPGAQALERARRLGVPAECPPAGSLRTRIEDERPWLDNLRAHGIQAILLAGFMRRLHSSLLDAYAGNILNIHPSLLPAFPGLRSIERAFDHGARVVGCTVHVVSEEVDGGAIIGQRAVEVLDGDTVESLTQRVHAAEHELYPQSVIRYFGESPQLEGRRLVFGSPARHGGAPRD